MVVSCPATNSRKQKPRSSSSLKRCPSTSASTKALMRSSRGRIRLSARNEAK